MTITIKTILSPITRIMASIFKKFIPFYWLYEISDKRRFQVGVNYLSPIKVFLGILILGCTISFLPIILNPFLGPTLAIIVGFAIAGIVPNFTNKLIQFSAKLGEKFLCLFNPSRKEALQKYGHHMPFRHVSADVDLVHLNKLEKNAIEVLYQAKKSITKHPEGWFGLSSKQTKEHRDLKNALHNASRFGRYTYNGEPRPCSQTEKHAFEAFAIQYKAKYNDEVHRFFNPMPSTAQSTTMPEALTDLILEYC